MRDIQNVLEYFKVRIIFQARNIQSNALNMKWHKICLNMTNSRMFNNKHVA